VIEGLWENIGQALAKEWTARMLTPAFAFWGGGLLAWAFRYGWGDLAAWWSARSALEQAALLVGGLLLVAFSAVVMEQVQNRLLWWAEGYGPRPLERLRFALARRWERKPSKWRSDGRNWPKNARVTRRSYRPRSGRNTPGWTPSGSASPSTPAG
jgi:hypothetical protein